MTIFCIRLIVWTLYALAQTLFAVLYFNMPGINNTGLQQNQGGK